MHPSNGIHALQGHQTPIAPQPVTALVNSVNACLVRCRIHHLGHWQSGHWQYDYISEGSQKIWGLAAEALLENPQLWQERVLPEDWAGVILPTYQRLPHTCRCSYEYRYRHPHRGLRWIAVDLTVEPQSDQHSCIVNALCCDVTQRKLQEQQLQNRMHWELLLRTITEDIRRSLELDTILATTVAAIRQILRADRGLVFSLEGSGQVRVLKQAGSNAEAAEPLKTTMAALSSACEEFYCRGLPHMVQHLGQDPWTTWLEGLLPREASLVVAPILKNGTHRLWGLLIVQTGGGQRTALEGYRSRRWQPQEASFLQQVANQLGIAIHQADLYQQLQAANHQLTQLSTRDPLTQLLNRRAFDSALEREWQRSMRSQLPLCLMLIDIDYFKRFNDAYGHPAGDACLVRVAQALSGTVNRPGDVLARYGGEEFIVLLPDTDAAGAHKICANIQAALRHLAIPHRDSPIHSYVTVSCGLVWSVPQSGDEPEALIAAADAALYRAKNQGRNVSIIEPRQPPQAA